MFSIPNYGAPILPEEVGAIVLRQLAEKANSQINGDDIRDVVITIPANFVDQQRKATMDAARIAGLNVIKLISEPVAAAFAYGIHGLDLTELNTILVVDFGGGTCDIAVLTFMENDWKVLSVDADMHLGGDDLDNAMTELIMSRVKSQFAKVYGDDIADDRGLQTSVRAEAERAKKHCPV